MKTSIFVLLILSTSIISFSQPKFTLNITGGYSLPLPDLKGDFPDSYAGFYDTSAASDVNSTYLVKSGFNLNLYGKYALGKDGKFRIIGGIGYNGFSQKLDYNYIDTIGTRNHQISVLNRVSIFSMFFGPEYAFNPKGKLNPFVGLDLRVNFFGGRFERTSDTASFSFKADRKGETRYGLAAGAGLDIAFSKTIGVVVGAKFHLDNLLNKQADTTTTTISSQTPIEIPLNDKEHTLNGQHYPSKNVEYLQFYIGLSVYFGQPKRQPPKNK